MVKQATLRSRRPRVLNCLPQRHRLLPVQTLRGGTLKDHSQGEIERAASSASTAATHTFNR